MMKNKTKILRLQAQIVILQANMLKYGEKQSRHKVAKAAVERRKEAIEYLKDKEENIMWIPLRKKFQIV